MSTRLIDRMIPAEYRDLLSPGAARDVAIRMARVPEDERTDILQEAMLAYVQGRKPDNGAAHEEVRMWKHRKREIPISQLLPDDPD